MISFLLSVLGFGTASTIGSCAYGTPVVEYGTPYATFKVIGQVQSETNSNTLPSIRVVMGEDTTFTDASGNYQVENMDFPKGQVFLVEFEDIDGVSNGEYQPLDTIVEFTNPVFSGGSGGWDSGETDKEINVRLKDKE